LDDHRHRHRAAMPAAGRQPAEMGLGCCFVRQVERLRVVFGGEGEHLLAGDVVLAEAALRADDHILKIFHHACPFAAPAACVITRFASASATMSFRMHRQAATSPCAEGTALRRLMKPWMLPAASRNTVGTPAATSAAA